MDKFSQKSEEFWGEVSKKFRGADFLNKPPGEALEFQTFLEFLDLDRGSSLIELGCGAGRYAIPLLKLGYKVTGVDISENSLKILEETAQKLGLEKNLEIVRGNFRQTVLENRFDGAYCVSTFHLLARTEEERIKIFGNLVKAVKKRGVVLVIEPNPLNPLFYPFYFFSPDASWDIEKYFLRSTSANLRKIFSELGLTDVQVRRHGFLPSLLISYLPFVRKMNFFMSQNRFSGNFAAFNFIKAIKSDRTH